MEYVVYILYSQKHQKSYTGISSNLISRFHSHNKYATKGWTISYRPWIVIHIEFFESKKEALSREKWFKSGIGRKEKKEIINQFFNIV
ncbi:GIY-YIG nuclease family protein [uncultured Dokdonia sp.]|uniref:GIY-YIG nuclease family protein n=1 Tax=uncultured Dokdonia sp. TaxID=575653 RepID=UPI00262F2903|nr:GIY-YIG nuclease family protein [uncultured Dokdonia sp.]